MRVTTQAVVPLVVAACAPGDAARDSHSSVEVPQWSADSIPIVDITGLAPDGSLRFEFAAGATRLSDGTIVVADAWGGAVKHFDPHGRVVRSTGRHGRGPGEFARIAWLGQCLPETLFVWDGSLERMTVLSAAGDVVRIFRLRPAGGELPPPFIFACSRRGVLGLLTLAPGQDSRYEIRTGDAPLLRGILWLADAHGVTQQRFGEVTLGRSSPLRGLAQIALSTDRVYLGSNDSAFVDAYTFSGEPVAVLPVGIEPGAPDTSHLRPVVEAMAQQLRDPDDRRPIIDLAMRMPLPERLPSYAALFADPSGNLWVQVSHPGDSLTHLRAIAPNGEILGDLRVAEDLRVFEVGRDYVLGAFEDDGGEPHVAVFTFRRRDVSM